MAWWDHEELKSPEMRSDRYITAFPSGYSPEQVAAAQRRLDMVNHAYDDQDHEPPMRSIPRMTAPRPELEELVKQASSYVMTDAERYAQQRSWALGEYMLAHPEVTRDAAIQTVDDALAAAGIQKPQGQAWRGLFKLIEEMGELSQVLGKLGPFPYGNHPDGGPVLQQRLEEELADVQAAIIYFREQNKLSHLPERCDAKLDKFRQWGLTGVPI